MGFFLRNGAHRDFRRSFQAKAVVFIVLFTIVLLGSRKQSDDASVIPGNPHVFLRSLLQVEPSPDATSDDVTMGATDEAPGDGEEGTPPGDDVLPSGGEVLPTMDEATEEGDVEASPTAGGGGDENDTTEGPEGGSSVADSSSEPSPTTKEADIISTAETIQEEEEICTEPAYHEFPTDAFTSHQRQKGAIIFHIILTVYMFIALALVCDIYFVASLDKICERLHMSSDVAGATFMAAGSSAPELFTSIIGVFVAKGDVGVGTIVGSAVFNILFVIGACGIFVSQAVYLSHWPLIRDSVCYAISIIALIASISNGSINWFESLVMLILYIGYIILMKFNTEVRLWVNQRVDLEKLLGSEEEVGNNILPADSEKKYYGNYEIFQNEPMKNNITSYGADKNHIAMSRTQIIPVDKYVISSTRKMSWEDACFRFMRSRPFTPKTRFRSAVYTIMLERRKLVSDPAFMKRIRMRGLSSSYEESEGHSFTSARLRRSLDECGTEQIDDWKRIRKPDEGYLSFAQWVFLYPLNAVLYFTVPDCRKPRWDHWYLVTFLMSIVWIAAFSYIMVWMVTLIGYTMGIPDSIMGITFLAAGTSVPDAMASVMVARQGQGDMAVSNTIGSNVFDVLIGLALPWFLMTACVNPGSYVHINSNGMIFSVLLLFLSIIFTLGAIHWAKWRLDKRLGFIFIGVYAIFLTFSILIEFNVFGYVNPPMCIEP